jgi:hypothetical protein
LTQITAIWTEKIASINGSLEKRHFSANGYITALTLWNMTIKQPKHGLRISVDFSSSKMERLICGFRVPFFNHKTGFVQPQPFLGLAFKASRGRPAIKIKLAEKFVPTT